MKIWTIQPEALYKILLLHKVIHCDATKSEFLQEWGFEQSYKWMAEQMMKRVGNPPDGVTYPIWAWHTLDGKHKKPDLRKIEFRGFNGNQVCIELEIPDNEVLLSDEVMWHSVLSDSYITKSEEDNEIDAEYQWFDTLPKEQQKNVKEKSWQNIFDVFSLQNNAEGNTKCSYIQATFWELHLDNIVDVRCFKGRQ